MSADEDRPYAVMPENSMRKKLGRDIDMDKIFTPEKIQECQDIINTAHADFYEDARKAVAEIEAVYAQANTTPDEPKVYIQQINRIASSIKSKMEAMGLTLGFQVAQLLTDFTRQPVKDYPKNLLIISKHIDVLSAIIKENKSGDDTAIGQQILDGLTTLIKKTAV